jgi:hypothetical protein
MVRGFGGKNNYQLKSIKMEKSKVEIVKKELSKVDFYKIIEIATKKFSDACYDEGLSVEKTKKLLYSKQGLDIIAKEAAKLI